MAPALHLLLDQDACELANMKIKALQDDIAQWKTLTLSTGFAEPVTA